VSSHSAFWFQCGWTKGYVVGSIILSSLGKGMAAAVYLHNALFSHSPLDQAASSSESNEEFQDVHVQEDAENAENAVINVTADDELTALADISTPLSSLADADANASAGANANVQHATSRDNNREHTRKSSETTLVPPSPLWTSTRRKEPLTLAGLNTRPYPIPNEEDEALQQQQQHTIASEDIYPEGYIDIPLTTTSEAPNYPDSTPQTPDRHSPLPPGLPAHTSSTSRRQPTPFPRSSHPSSFLRDSSTSAVDTHRTRPKGRRRPLETNPDPNLRNSPIARIIRKGRVLNQSLSRTSRIIILIGRGFLTAILCGWAAYSSARYWLAYSGQLLVSSPVPFSIFPLSPNLLAFLPLAVRNFN
jgi:hypothetical protein